MKMELNFKERLLLPGLLIKPGNLIDQRLMRDIIEKAEFTTDEIQEFEIVILPGDRFVWKREGFLNLELNERQVLLLIENANYNDENNFINQQNLELIEKLINLKTK